MSDEKKSRLDQWLGENQLDEKPQEGKEKSPLEIVESALRNELGIKNMSVDPVSGVIQFSIAGKNTDSKVRVTVNQDSRLVATLAYFPFKAPEEKMNLMLVLASLRNRQFRFGCDVAYDEFYSHEVYHFLPQNGPDLDLIAHLVSGAIRSVDEAFPLAMGILHGGKTPKVVLEEYHQAKAASKKEGGSHEE